MNNTNTIRISPQLYRAAAICSMLSAVTTLMIIFLPGFYTGLEGFEARMLRVTHPLYTWRAWGAFIHPFLAAFAAFAVALRLRRQAPELLAVGLLMFLLWLGVEATQHAVTLMAFDPWRLAWLRGDEAVRGTMALRTAIYDGIWDSLYFVVLVAFLIANFCYAAATLRQRGLTRVLGVFYCLAALLTAYLISTTLGGPALPEAVEFWIYPLTQPLARALIGVWLWRHAEETRSLLREQLQGGSHREVPLRASPNDL